MKRMAVLDELEKIWYFMKRDIVSFSTYKTNIFVLLLTAVFGALSFAFVGQSSINQAVTEHVRHKLHHLPDYRVSVQHLPWDKP